MLDENVVSQLDNRRRNQLVGSMHAHNELAALNRVLIFSMNNTGQGELHDSSQTVQMWMILQILVGKIFETWNMISDRFLTAVPEDSAIGSLSVDHRGSLDWLKDYFGADSKKTNALRIIRDRAAFHYDKLNLSTASQNMGENENAIYLASHPANSLYYFGSALVFRTIFATIGQAHDKDGAASTMSHSDIVKFGAHQTMQVAQEANLHLHKLLYGLISHLLEEALGQPLHKIEHVRIPVLDVPDPDSIALPIFIDIGK
jgi:hypothetical protein